MRVGVSMCVRVCVGQVFDHRMYAFSARAVCTLPLHEPANSVAARWVPSPPVCACVFCVLRGGVVGVYAYLYYKSGCVVE